MAAKNVFFLIAIIWSPACVPPDNGTLFEVMGKLLCPTCRAGLRRGYSPAAPVIKSPSKIVSSKNKIRSARKDEPRQHINPGKA